MCVFCVRIWLLRTFVYGFWARCAAFAKVYIFLCTLSVFCLRIQLFVRYEWLLRTDTDFWFLESLGDPILRVLWFFESPDVPILRVRWFVEILCGLSWWLDRLQYPYGGSDLQVFFSDNLHVIIGLSGGSSIQGSIEFFIRKYSRDSPSYLTSYCFLLIL